MVHPRQVRAEEVDRRGHFQEGLTWGVSPASLFDPPFPALLCSQLLQTLPQSLTHHSLVTAEQFALRGWEDSRLGPAPWAPS